MRVKRHLRLTRSLETRIRASPIFDVIRQYLGADVVIFDIQQIFGGRRRQVCHRDHNLGPVKCATLAISDRPLGTRIYTKSHLHDRDMDCHLLNHTPLSSSQSSFKTISHFSLEEDNA